MPGRPSDPCVSHSSFSTNSRITSPKPSVRMARYSSESRSEITATTAHAAAQTTAAASVAARLPAPASRAEASGGGKGGGEAAGAGEREEGGGIGAERENPRHSEIHHAAETPLQIEREAEDGDDADQRQDGDEIGDHLGKPLTSLCAVRRAAPAAAAAAIARWRRS